MLPHTTRVVLIACHVSLAGFLYGLDTGVYLNAELSLLWLIILVGSIGPVIEMLQFRNSIGQLTSTQQGLYVSCILLSASFSSLASGYVSDRISRKYGILVGGVLSLIGSIISATAPNFAALIAARLITGLGAGQAICVTTIYLVEIAPLEIRGVLACLLQLYIVLGITIGYFISFGAQNLHGSIAWRVLFMIQGIIALILSIGMVFLPFSPRWLVQKGRTEEARRVLFKIRPQDKANAELAEIQTSMFADSENSTANFREIFAKRYRTRTMLGVFLMAFQQLTGVRTLTIIHTLIVHILYRRLMLYCIMLPFSSSRPVSLRRGLHSLPRASAVSSWSLPPFPPKFGWIVGVVANLSFWVVLLWQLPFSL